MRAAFALLAIAACYSPRIQSGAPCANGPEPRCPRGQVCVPRGGIEVCLDPDDVQPDDAAIDAHVDDMMIDGNPLLDTDNDGVKDDKDNCIAKPNKDQYNEDGDVLGDLCDPCPVSPINTDGDNDGVGDVCDPRPSSAGETIALFEGFNTAVPNTWTIFGSWTFQNGFAVITVGAGERAYLAAPITTDTGGTSATAVTPLAQVGNGPAEIGVIQPIARQTGVNGIACLLFDDGARGLGLFDVGAMSSFEAGGFDWDENTQYVMIHRRLNDGYQCGVGNETQADTQSVLVLQPTVAIGTRSLNGRFAWLMHVESPNPN